MQGKGSPAPPPPTLLLSCVKMGKLTCIEGLYIWTVNLKVRHPDLAWVIPEEKLNYVPHISLMALHKQDGQMSEESSPDTVLSRRVHSWLSTTFPNRNEKCCLDGGLSGRREGYSLLQLLIHNLLCKNTPDMEFKWNVMCAPVSQCYFFAFKRIVLQK